MRGKGPRQQIKGDDDNWVSIQEKSEAGVGVVNPGHSKALPAALRVRASAGGLEGGYWVGRVESGKIQPYIKAQKS